MKPSRFIPLDGLDLSFDPSPPPAASPGVLARWATMRSANPRLHNGPILACSVGPDGAIIARRDTYQRLAVQAEDRTLVEPPVMQLSVTGVLVAPGAAGVAGAPAILFGKRSPQTRIYQSMWELAPSGGLDPADDGAAPGMADVLAQLEREAEEELGFLPEPLTSRVLGLVIDPVAMSTDVVIRQELAHRPVCREAGWEYTETRWVQISDIKSFITNNSVIPPTLAILQTMR